MSAEQIDGLKALAHPLRLRILEALGKGERNVGEIETITGIGQPALSQQLSILRKAGLVDTRKEAKLVYYRLVAEQFVKLAETISALAPMDGPQSRTRRQPSPGVANFARLS